MKMKKFLAALLALVMVLSLAACGGSKSDDTAAEDEDLGNVEDFVDGDSSDMVKVMPALDDPSSANLKDTVIIANVRDMTTVNPYDTNTTEVLNMLRMTHSRMFRQNPETYELENDLCTEYEQIDDLHWTFKLRDDVVFHNGEKMTADDVVYSFNLMKEYSYTAAKTEFIDEVVKVDDYTVEFVLNENSQDFKNILSYPNVCIVNQKAIEADEVMGPAVGTGAYVITEWTLGEQTVLTRNENFYGEKPLTEKWIIKLMTEDTARVIALENGEADFCIQPPVQEWSYIDEGENTTLLQAVANKLIYLAINLQGSNEALQVKEVRQAIAMTVNRENIVIAGKDGKAVVANSVLSPKTPFYNPDQEALPLDIEQAKQLLADAGYADGFEMTISFQGATYKTIAQLIQADLAQIGITVNCEELEASSLKTKMQAGEHDMVIYNWGPSPGEGTDITARSLFYSGSGSNRQLLADPHVDDIIDRASVEPDVEKRQELYYELQSWMIDNAGMIPLYYEYVGMGVSSNLHNFILEVSEQHDFTYAYVEE